MKKLTSLFIVVLLLSCEGPQGPEGIPGADAAIIASSAFEIAIDFNTVNNYEFIEPYGFDVYPYDVTLVYILWETADGQDIWRLLPQSTTFDDDSTLTYNYDFTQDDVRFFLDGTTDFNTLDAVWTQNQIFRVVVVPADNVGRFNNSDINSVMQILGISTFEKR